MMLVPFAIKEAENLYSKHMYVSLALWQMWRTREDYIHSESGLEHLSGTDDVTEALNKMKLSVSKPASHCAPSYDRCRHQDEGIVEAETDALPDMALLDAKIAETEAAMKAADVPAEKRRLKIKREDLMRLRRVEQIYVCFCPALRVCTCLMRSTERCSSSALQLGACLIEASPSHCIRIISGSAADIC
jgi:hypothetical protein